MKRSPKNPRLVSFALFLPGLPMLFAGAPAHAMIGNGCDHNPSSYCGQNSPLRTYPASSDVTAAPTAAPSTPVVYQKAFASPAEARQARQALDGQVSGLSRIEITDDGIGIFYFVDGQALGDFLTGPQGQALR